MLTLTRPDDWHLHLRDGAALAAVVGHTAAVFRRAIVMPNLKPPVRTTEEARAYLAGLGGETSRETAFSSMIVFPTRGGQTRIVQVRALEGGFPFYGEVVTAPAGAFTQLRAGDQAILEDTLLAQFGVKVGDPVRIGEATFTVAGALQKIPGESPAVAMLAPRPSAPSDGSAAARHPAVAAPPSPRRRAQPCARQG